MINLIVLNLANNANEEMCSQCKGACCKSSPGIYTSDQFEQVTTEVIVEMLRSGNYGIDWWEADQPTYYIRPRIVNIPEIYGAWGGECQNLSDKGCTLNFDSRPYECQMLEPNWTDEGPNCKIVNGLNKKQVVDTWLPYQQEIKRAIDIFQTETDDNQSKSIPDN